MFDWTLALNFWTGAAILVGLYLVKWRLDPLYHLPTVGGSSLPLLSYIGARKFVTNGKEIMQEGYSKYLGRAFKVPMMGEWAVFVSGPEMVDYIRRKPGDQLSLRETFADVSVSTSITSSRSGLTHRNQLMQLRRIFQANVVDDAYHVDIIKNTLTRALSSVMPYIIDEMSLAMPEHIPAPADSQEWAEVNLMGALAQIVARVSARVFVGLPLCRNREYLDLTQRFAGDLMKDRETLRWWPQFLRPYVYTAGSLSRQSLRRNAEILQPVIEGRMEMMNTWGEDWTNKPNDLLQWIMEAKRTDAQDKTIPERVMSANAAAIQSSSMAGSLALLRLAENPEYIAPIREEIETVILDEGWTKNALAKLRKLDSLFKEVLRFQGLILNSLSRKVMQDMTLPDGTFLPRGTTLHAIAYGVHHDDAKYENPDVFDPFRFSRVREASEEELVKNQFVNTSPDYLSFGHGIQACPGRFFAANELKALLAYIILNYDFKSSSKGLAGAPTYHEMDVIPPLSATLMFRRRESKV